MEVDGLQKRGIYFLKYSPSNPINNKSTSLKMTIWRQTVTSKRHYQNQWWPWGQGWGLLSQFPPFCYFPNFSELWNHTLAIDYHVYIWQVSPQLSCGGTCQIWMWLKEFNMYFCKIENFAYGEINERSFSNPHPCSTDFTISRKIPRVYGFSVTDADNYIAA